MSLRQYFADVATALDTMRTGDEVYTARFAAEDSDFVRFNRGAIRQAGHVLQRELHLDWIEGPRHAVGSIRLSGDLSLDRPRLVELTRDLRERRACLPEDPYLLYATEVRSTELERAGTLPAPDAAIASIRAAAGGRDLVGVYAAGDVYHGFANSFGQRNWSASRNFNLDWSFYLEADKAVKSSYAGFAWSEDELGRKVSWAADQLDVLRHPSRTVEPGRYRVYLAPAALGEIVRMLSWDGFGLKAQRTRLTPLLKLVEGECSLHPGLTLRENAADGVAPNFQDDGFLRPDAVTLIGAGRHRDSLVSPRSAREYGVPTNGASEDESPESVEILPGSVPRDGVIAELGTGIYVGNLWYLNWSDRGSCRTTGMTRFGTFWVENGSIQAPLKVMRFDESAYRMLGDNLVGLTREREVLLDPGSYGQRSTLSDHLPGALIEDFTLTL